MVLRATVEERFWATVEPTGFCWNWTGKLYLGYGHFNADKKAHRAHRWAYELLVGPIPAGLVLDHLCRNIRCVNPDHLEPVTIAENNLRGFSPWAKNARLEQCVNGHDLTDPANVTRPKKRPSVRQCLTCNRDRAAAKRALEATVHLADGTTTLCGREGMQSVDESHPEPTCLVCIYTKGSRA